MRLLLDSCVWGGARQTLSAAGHDVVCASDWERDPGDTEILAYAHRERRVLVTLDKDFGELAVLQGQPHNGIIRLVGFSAVLQAVVCLHIIEKHSVDLDNGALITAEPGRLRIRL